MVNTLSNLATKNQVKWLPIVAEIYAIFIIATMKNLMKSYFYRSGYKFVYLAFIIINVTLLAVRQRSFVSQEQAFTIQETTVYTEEPSPQNVIVTASQNFEAAPLVTDNSLVPNWTPITFKPELPAHEFTVYEVKRGDTPAGIAEKFGIKPESLLGGNPLLSEVSNALQPGTELIILPIDGLIHNVKSEDTIESISKLYNVDQEIIIDYVPNNLSFPYRLIQNSKIVIPGAVKEIFVWNPPTIADITGSSEGRGVQPIIIGTGSFVWPLASRNFTQFFWYGHPGLDVASVEGSNVFASDTGTVTFAGWNNYGYGNLIVINHGNGFETFYAHLSQINVVPGQIVYQGNLIGAVGNSGNSSGPHLHFEVRINANQDDPCWYLGC